MKEEALKLADELAMKIFHGEHTDWLVNDAVYMIRKLVAELEERTNENTDLRVMIASKFAELDKQGEPVAWISKYSLKDIEQFCEIISLSPTKDDYFDTPLYTTPQTKPLSDEEILEILIDKGICGRLKDGSLCYWQADADLHDFARAIEERHGIK